jgi:methylamine---glutamate N-methyltransferase subunit B
VHVNHPALGPADVVIAVPEVRDYRAINSELARGLDAGCGLIRLAGVHGQRLLAAGLAGSWAAVIELDGDAGPELAAGLDAPRLTVICRGRAGDGAASRLRAGTVLVHGAVGTAYGYAQVGGLAVACGGAGARAGLGQLGGDLVLLDTVGPLPGERQSGGRVFAFADRIGPHAGRGGRAGRFIRLAADESATGIGDAPVDRAAWFARLEPLRACLALSPGSPAARLLASSPTWTNTGLSR